MKTVKYAISFYSVDTDLSTNIPISKKEYIKQLSFLKKKEQQTANDECPVEHMRTVNETEQIILIQDSFTVASGTTFLTRCECKDGYHFK